MNLEEMSDEELLTEAKKQGYNENFEGENKKSPKEFLEIGLTHNHVLKERNDKLSHQIEELTANFKNLQQTTKKFADDMEAQKKKAVEKAIKELQTQRRDAIKEGNVEEVEEIDKEIQEKQEVAKNDQNPILEAWIDKNPWYRDDEDVGVEADVIAETLMKTGRFNVNTEEGYKKFLSQVERRTKEKFPEKFSNQKKNNPPEVEGGRPSPTKKSKKTFEDLPRDAQEACKEFEAMGLMKREQYLAAYEWE